MFEDYTAIGFASQESAESALADVDEAYGVYETTPNGYYIIVPFNSQTADRFAASPVDFVLDNCSALTRESLYLEVNQIECAQDIDLEDFKFALFGAPSEAPFDAPSDRWNACNEGDALAAFERHDEKYYTNSRMFRVFAPWQKEEIGSYVTRGPRFLDANEKPLIRSIIFRALHDC